jgi:hypothetical protein
MLKSPMSLFHPRIITAVIADTLVAARRTEQSVEHKSEHKVDGAMAQVELKPARERVAAQSGI